MNWITLQSTKLLTFSNTWASTSEVSYVKKYEFIGIKWIVVLKHVWKWRCTFVEKRALAQVLKKLYGTCDEATQPAPQRHVSCRRPKRYLQNMTLLDTHTADRNVPFVKEVAWGTARHILLLKLPCKQHQLPLLPIVLRTLHKNWYHPLLIPSPNPPILIRIYPDKKHKWQDHHVCSNMEHTQATKTRFSESTHWTSMSAQGIPPRSMCI